MYVSQLYTQAYLRIFYMWQINTIPYKEKI